jgi:hypothetical protein
VYVYVYVCVTDWKSAVRCFSWNSSLTYIQASNSPSPAYGPQSATSAYGLQTLPHLHTGLKVVDVKALDVDLQRHRAHTCTQNAQYGREISK